MSNVRSHLPKLLVFEGSYFSPSDEKAFHDWLGSIPGVTRVHGTPEGLEITLRSRFLGDSSLRELLALHFRYRLPMRDLAQFRTEKNATWFFDPLAYWYPFVFGPTAVSANVDGRLRELRASEASPVQAIKAIRQEYQISLAEAKRRLSISPVWQGHVQANRPLQEEAVALVERSSFERRGGGT